MLSTTRTNHGVRSSCCTDLRTRARPRRWARWTFSRSTRENGADYLLDHYQAHLSNASLLNLPGIPDLSSVDLADPNQYGDWMALHAQVHANEDSALGLL